MMVPLQKVLEGARAGCYAIGSFNVYNSETIRGVIESGVDMNLPTIVAFGAGYIPNMRLKDAAALVRSQAADAPIDIALHLDHCKSLDIIREALDAGFTSVMYDGSALPFAENLANAAKVVSMAHAAGAGVEAELGGIAKGTHSNEEDGSEIYTSPDEAVELVRETGIDALAVSIGTVHGMYAGEPRVDVGRLKKIAAVVDIPLVLHGGSGTPEAIIRDCINNGIAKINVNTEISMHTVAKARAAIEANPKIHLSKLCLTEIEAIKEVVKKYMEFFRNR
ncbi:MAG: class II fructose-bisphosphate aldolase [Methylobacteriaceae bacterium]|jgi:fructose-bisphosphate aldolase class II|nr:class II fructose-bisphosphate aldolase [Methylobacteriaceae bacterium]